MRRLIPSALVAAVLAAACTSSGALPPGVTTSRPPPDPPPSPAEVREIDDCGDLVEVGVSYVENMIQALEGDVSLDVLSGDVPAPAEIQFLIDVGRELDDRAVSLECDLRRLNAEIAADTADIESTDPVVAVFLEIVRSGTVAATGDGS